MYTPSPYIYTLSLHDALPILKGGVGKYILKKALESVLPIDILYRSKQGFAVPLDVWFRRDLKDLAHQAILETEDRKSTRLNSSHITISYAVFCLKKKKITHRLSLPGILNRHVDQVDKRDRSIGLAGRIHPHSSFLLLWLSRWCHGACFTAASRLS